MNADPELDAALWRKARVALARAVLHLDRATHRIDHAAELRDEPVPRALDDPSTMRGDSWINQIAAQRPQPSESSLLIRPGEPAVADDIGDQDRCNFPGLAHGAP